MGGFFFAFSFISSGYLFVSFLFSFEAMAKYTFTQSKNYLRAAKRRIIDSLKKSGFDTTQKHKILIKHYFEQNGIVAPVSKKINVFLIDLYLDGKLDHIELIPRRKGRESKNQVLDQEKNDAKKAEYNEYLNSVKWRNFRQDVFAHYGNKCILCDSPTKVEVHHKHYRTFGNETLQDVVPLCQKCHRKHHGRT